MCPFGSKSRDNTKKYFQHLKDIGQISKQLTRTRLESDHFPRAAALRANKASKLSGMKVKTISFQLLKGISFPTFNSCNIQV